MLPNFPHKPVLQEEILAAFKDLTLHRYVDGTLGAGGHANAILEAHPEIEKFYGFDQDLSALKMAQQRLLPFKEKCHFFHSNFEKMKELIHQTECIDGILLDLGVSSMQLDQADKGFSFSKEGPLDMRMNNEQELTAATIINSFSEEALGEIFRDYGEETQWRKAAKEIVNKRKKQPILTTTQLAQVLNPVLFRKGKINPLTLIFQGLRIYVNRELDVLQSVLPQTIQLLAKGGRLAVISFHSLEDRIVKQIFKQEASSRIESENILEEPQKKQPTIKILTKKPIEASIKEIKINPRSRSAKLRIIERI